MERIAAQPHPGLERLPNGAVILHRDGALEGETQGIIQPEHGPGVTVQIAYAGKSFKDYGGDDRALVDVRRGLIAVFDGAGGTSAQGSPAVAATTAAGYTAEFGALHEFNFASGEQAADTLENVLFSSSRRIIAAGGGVSTALAATLCYVNGQPGIALASAGDSRAIGRPIPESITDGTQTWLLQELEKDHPWYWENKLRDKLDCDGTVANELLATRAGDLKCWVGAGALEGCPLPIQTAFLPLTPGVRQRIVLFTDGVSGDSPDTYLHAQTVAEILEAKSPEAAARQAMAAARQYDDRVIVAADFLVQ